MTQMNRLTTAHRTNALADAGTSGTNSGFEFTGQDANEAVRLAIAHPMTATPFTHARDWNSNAETAPASTGREANADEHRSAIVNLPPRWARREPAATLHPLQEWEGYVIEIREAEFTARLLDLTAGGSFEEEEADIALAEIAEADAAKLEIGSIFRWVIGYERSAMGTKRRVSHIVFRDLPAVTRADRQAGEEWAHRIATAFGR